MDNKIVEQASFPAKKNYHNIWRYVNFYDSPPAADYRLTLEEGGTKCLAMPLIAEKLGLTALFFKREDLNPTGSHKDRSLAFQISKYSEQRVDKLLISSSGNAGISASAYTTLTNINMFVFVSPKTPQTKVQQIQHFGGKVIVTNRAITFAKLASQKLGIPNLRPSTNPFSIEGFQSIGFELFEQLSTIDAIFTFVSSASSLIGIGRAFRQLKEKYGLIKKVPQLHAVQSGLVTSVASHFAKPDDKLKRKRSLVGDLGTKKSALTDEAISYIQASGGSGWIVSDEEITEAAKMLWANGISTSSEGCATFAGIQQATEKLGDLGRVVHILTGHGSQWENFPEQSTTELPVLNSFSEIAKIINPPIVK